MFLLTLAGFAMAATAGLSPTAAQPPAKPAKERLICRHEDVTGTRMGGQTICKTEAQWRNDSEQAQDMLRDRVGKDVIVPEPRRAAGGN